MQINPPQSHSKTALVLAGGGLTGAGYEIGALGAGGDLRVDRTVNGFACYVATSAGSLVGSMLASRLDPKTMLQALAGLHPEIPPIERSDLFHFDLQDLVRLGIKLPQTVIGAWSHYLRYTNDMTLFDVLWSLSEVLPTGLYDNRALERYLRRGLKQQGQSNRFEDLERDLHVVATDVDTGQRVVFSRDSQPAVPISVAVAASTAVPILYKPVRIHDHDYMDGGVRGNASLDVAIEHGAKLVVCINPLVPFDNSDRSSIPFFGPDGGYLSDKGFTAIASQVTRVQSHSGLLYHIKQLRKTHPEVDIILIEPSPTDYQMSFYSIMRYSTRLIVARHGFETVTLKLAEDYPYYRELLSRHGIPINPRLVDEELRKIQQSNYNPKVIREVLGALPPTKRRAPSEPIDQLKRTLDELESALAGIASGNMSQPPIIGEGFGVN